MASTSRVSVLFNLTVLSCPPNLVSGPTINIGYCLQEGRST